jgi:hypothetical protein
VSMAIATKEQFLYKRDQSGKLLGTPITLPDGLVIKMTPLLIGELNELTQLDNNDKVIAIIARHISEPEITLEDLVSAGKPKYFATLLDKLIEISEMPKTIAEQKKEK